jgi:hypothetical protein
VYRCDILHLPGIFESAKRRAVGVDRRRKIRGRVVAEARHPEKVATKNRVPSSRSPIEEMVQERQRPVIVGLVVVANGGVERRPESERTAPGFESALRSEENREGLSVSLRLVEFLACRIELVTPHEFFQRGVVIHPLPRFCDRSERFGEESITGFALKGGSDAFSSE